MNVGKDGMVSGGSAVGLYWLDRKVERGVPRRRAVAAAVAIAAAFLSKASAIFFPIPFIVVILTENAGWKNRLKFLSVLSVSIALALPWLIRNQVLYGDPLAKKAMLIAVDFLVSHKSITSPY